MLPNRWTNHSMTLISYLIKVIQNSSKYVEGIFYNLQSLSLQLSICMRSCDEASEQIPPMHVLSLVFRTSTSFQPPFLTTSMPMTHIDMRYRTPITFEVKQNLETQCKIIRRIINSHYLKARVFIWIIQLHGPMDHRLKSIFNRFSKKRIFQLQNSMSTTKRAIPIS